MIILVQLCRTCSSRSRGWLFDSFFIPSRFFFSRNPIPIVIHRKLSSVVHLRGISALTYPLFCAQLLIQGYSSPENGLSPSGHHKQRWGCNSSSGRGCITSLKAGVTLGQFIGGRHRVERRRHRRREDSKRQNNSINYKLHHLTKKHSDLNNRKKNEQHKSKICISSNSICRGSSLERCNIF